MAVHRSALYPLTAGRHRRTWTLGRKAGLLFDLAAAMLPAMLLLAFIDYTAWCAWWI
jgi:hypothetical protein